MTGTLATALPPGLARISTDAFTEPFWLAAKERRLVVCKCEGCGSFRMPPTPFCPECQSTQIHWQALSGRATLYSFAIVRGYPGLSDITLVPAVLELAGAPGIKMVSNVIDVDPAEARIGMELEVDFHPIDDWQLPVFRPKTEATHE